jgi:hypothetical protein
VCCPACHELLVCVVMVAAAISLVSRFVHCERTTLTFAICMLEARSCCVSLIICLFMGMLGAGLAQAV